MLKKFLSYLYGGLASGTLTLTYVLLMTHILSPKDYGKGMFFISLLTPLFFFSNLGVDQVLFRFCYEEEYKQNFSLLFYRCSLIALAGFLLTSVIITTLARPLLEQLAMGTPLLISSLIIGTGLFTFLRLLKLVPRLLGHAKCYSILTTLQELFFLLSFLVLFFFFMGNFLSVILAQLTSMAAAIVVAFFVLKDRLLKPKTASTKVLAHRPLKTFITYGAPFTLSLSLTWGFTNIDKFFLLQWSNYSEVGIYTSAFALTAPLLLLEDVFRTTWAPLRNELLTAELDQVKEKFSLILEKATWGFSLVTLILILLRNKLVLLLGGEFGKAAVIFPWLLFFPYFHGLSEIVCGGIIKSKKSSWNLAISASSFLTNCIGCYYLVPFLGAKGAAISAAISFFLFFWLRLLLSYQYFKFDIKFFKLALYFICLFIFTSLATFSLMPSILTNTLILLGIFASILLERNWITIAAKKMTSMSKHANKNGFTK